MIRMNKEEEIEDSLRFCKEIQIYYKSGLFENPKNVFEWEKYIPLAHEEVEKKYQEGVAYQNKELVEAIQYTDRLMKTEEQEGRKLFSEENQFSVGISGNGAAVLEPTDRLDLPGARERKKREEIEDARLEEDEESSFLKIVLCRFVEVVVCIVLAFFISAGFNKFIGTHTMVEGTSMEGALQNGDYLLVDKISYFIGKPKRFDIIIFPYNEETYYIKRIIGMPGETIQIVDGKIYIDGEELLESYGTEPMIDGGMVMEEFTIGEGEYFVLGDNRNHSTDSRSENVGTVKEEKIVGKAFFRFYPIESFGSVE